MSDKENHIIIKCRDCDWQIEEHRHMVAWEKQVDHNLDTGHMTVKEVKNDRI